MLSSVAFRDDGLPVDSAQLSSVEKIRWQPNARRFEFFHESWPNTRRREVAGSSPFVVDSFDGKVEDVLHDDRFAFHAEHFRDVCDFSRTTLQTVDLDDQIDG